MQTTDTMHIIQALANGTDPVTGEVFPDTALTTIRKSFERFF